MTRKNVYELTLERIDTIFNEFDNVYVSFSGGKDSAVMLNLCIDYMRRHHIARKLGVFHMDYEVQYEETTRYIDRVFAANKDLLEIYRVCVPFKVTTCTSMYQTYWRPWEEEKRELWVREMPAECYTAQDFPFYSKEMWDYEFQLLFAQWYHRLKGANRTCCLVGIRTQESYNRWRTIYAGKRTSQYRNLVWTCRNSPDIYNAYILYDWLTTDIWTANGRFGWDYNRLYDLFYQAGVPLEKQRVASPFISAAQENLALYRAIDPDTWGKMICRVNGVNFTGIYGSSSAVARYRAKLPPGHTWESYMYFLLSTLPAKTRNNYLRKLSVSINFWRTRGGVLPDETIEKLKAMGIKIEVGERSSYNTDKKPVRMEYLDDIDIPGFKDLPTFKRMCVCILKNDHACKYMGFAPNKNKSPVYDVIPVPVSKIRANAYNPNVVAPPEMKLLELSIWEDGYTSPCVCYYDREHDIYELVDGYHRYMVMKTSDRIYEREEGMLPVVVIDKDLSNRMASTIRHNRARGTHSIELMTNIVAELKQAGMSDAWIMKNIGMDRDELLRLKQVSGLAALFADKEFSIPDNAFGTAPGRGIQNKKVFHE